MSAKNRLAAAARRGNVEEARAALDGGAGVDSTAPNYPTGRAPVLMLAAKNGHEAVVRLLLDRGAEADRADRHQQTALMLAARGGHEAVARLLLDRGADVNALGNAPVGRHDRRGNGTALFYAAEGGHEAVARLLLDRGAEMDKADSRGETPLMAALRENHEPVARFLIEHGADVAVAARQNNVLPIVARYGHEALARLLIEHGADVNAGGEFGSTPLLEAARHGHVAVMQLLAEHGASLDATALGAAAGRGRVSAARWLVAHGAEVDNVEYRKGTPLFHAVGKEAMVMFLFEAGAQLDTVVPRWGMTAMMQAVAEGRDGTVRLLAELGADLEVADENGGTALDCAVTNGSIATARILLSHGAIDRGDKWKAECGQVPLVRDCRAAVEDAVATAGDRDVARLCGDYVSMAGRWRVPGR